MCEGKAEHKAAIELPAGECSPESFRVSLPHPFPQ